MMVEVTPEVKCGKGAKWFSFTLHSNSDINLEELNSFYAPGAMVGILHIVYNWILTITRQCRHCCPHLQMRNLGCEEVKPR